MLIETVSHLDPYLQRTLSLAASAGTPVAANPYVGCVIVGPDGKIMGEGAHRVFGQAHAEVNAVERVKDKAHLSRSTLYVSLEPCNIHRKTPPCTDLILKYQIPKVVIGCLDPNPAISGRGIEILKNKGVEVLIADNPHPYIELNKTFFINQKFKRPFITVKWAETADGFIGSKKGERILISGKEALRYVHYLRSTRQAILAGKNTALRDNPYLNVRHFSGFSPLRMVIDIECDLPAELNLFHTEGKTLIINAKKNQTSEKVIYFSPQNQEAFFNLSALTDELFSRAGISSILVEGGRFLLQQFINQGVWDELIVIRSDIIIPEADISAPILMNNTKFDHVFRLGNDTVFIKENNLYL